MPINPPLKVADTTKAPDVPLSFEIEADNKTCLILQFNINMDITYTADEVRDNEITKQQEKTFLKISTTTFRAKVKRIRQSLGQYRALIIISAASVVLTQINLN